MTIFLPRTIPTLFLHPLPKSPHHPYPTLYHPCLLTIISLLLPFLHSHHFSLPWQLRGEPHLRQCLTTLTQIYRFFCLLRISRLDTPSSSLFMTASTCGVHSVSAKSIYTIGFTGGGGYNSPSGATPSWSCGLTGAVPPYMRLQQGTPLQLKSHITSMAVLWVIRRNFSSCMALFFSCHTFLTN